MYIGLFFECKMKVALGDQLQEIWQIWGAVKKNGD
jgi:hypothetical protein